MAFSFALSTLRWDEPNLEQLLESLHEHGWDGWETRQSLDWLGSAARVKGICNQTGVHVAGVMCASVMIEPEHSNHEINRRRIEFASDLECKLFVAKGPRRFDHDTTDEEFDRIADVYEGMAAYASGTTRQWREMYHADDYFRMAEYRLYHGLPARAWFMSLMFSHRKA